MEEKNQITEVVYPMIWDEECQNLDYLQNELSAKIIKSSNDITYDVKMLNSECFEDKERGNYSASTKGAINKQGEAINWWRLLIESPYFGRVDLTDDNGEQIIYYLSDQDKSYEYNINTGRPQTMILGFGESTTEFAAELLDRYYSKSSEMIVLKDGKYDVALRRRVEVEDGVLKEAEQHYPMLSGKDTTSISDDFLLRVLNSRRGQVGFESIITTIQKKQFEIIRSNIDDHFIVQGCAGSGKTHILLLRLFYLKRRLAGWGTGDLIILTPTNLFNCHTDGLLRKFKIQASMISLASYYWQLLMKYDGRNKERRYTVEFTEEYLPEEYLINIYSKKLTDEIRDAVSQAINNRIQKALALSNIFYSTDFEKTKSVAEKIKIITKNISEILAKQREIDKIVQCDDNLSKVQESLILNKQKFNEFNRKRQHAKIAIEEFTGKSVEVIPQIRDLGKMISVKNEIVSNFNKELKALSEGLKACYGRIVKNNLSGQEQFLLLCECVSFELRINSYDKTGLMRVKHDQLIHEVDADIAATNDVIAEKLGIRAKSFNWSRAIEEKKRALSLSFEALNKEINLIEVEIAIKEKERDDLIKEAGIDYIFLDENFRSEISNTLYYLQRLESSVFESEIWNKLLPIKEKYNVPTTITVLDENEKPVQNKVLYKSDLLYYLMIYYELNGNTPIKQSKMICIDEGQELSYCDYDMLFKLQSKAVFNIYGDINQQMHSGCWVGEWSDLNGKKVYELNENYRNACEIVEFCNNNYSTSMIPLGEPEHSLTKISINELGENIARLISESQTSAVVIKDESVFNGIIKKFGLAEEKLCLLDSNSSRPSADKLNVYTICAVKGLEFPTALVLADGMNNNQRYVACTRAMQLLILCEDRLEVKNG